MGFSKLILLGVVIFLCSVGALSVAYLALPGLTPSDSPPPFKPHQLVLSSTYLYRDAYPEVGDRVVFKEFNGSRKIGLVTNVNEYYLRDKDVYTIYYSKKEVPTVVSRNMIERKIYFPYVSPDEARVAVSKARQKTMVLSPVKQEPTPGVRQELYNLQYQIVQQTTSGENIIATVSATEDRHNIVRVGDTVFYIGFDNESGFLKALNVKDNRSTEVFRSEKGSERGVNNVQVIGDELFFADSGYLSGAFLYSLPLQPLKLEPRLISDKGFDIQKIKGNYFIIGGFGDGCGGYRTYTLFDLITRSQREITTSHLGCSNGDEVIGTTESKFIVSNHTRSEAPQEPNSGYYRSLGEITLANPPEKKILVGEDKMPAKVETVAYLPKSQKVAVLNEFLIIYDFKTGEFTPILKLPDFNRENEFSNMAVSEESENTICVIYNWGSPTMQSFGVKLDTHQVLTKYECAPDMPGESSLEKISSETKKYLENLSLPSNYKIVPSYRY